MVDFTLHDAAILAACGAAIHPNMLVFVSKDKVRCPQCNAIFTLKPGDIR